MTWECSYVGNCHYSYKHTNVSWRVQAGSYLATLSLYSNNITLQWWWNGHTALEVVWALSTQWPMNLGSRDLAVLLLLRVFNSNYHVQAVESCLVIKGDKKEPVVSILSIIQVWGSVFPQTTPHTIILEDFPVFLCGSALLWYAGVLHFLCM